MIIIVQQPQGVAQAAPVAPVFALGPGRGNALLVYALLDYNKASHIERVYPTTPRVLDGMIS